ncbi:hypothetical protein NX786_02130 [Telluria mixta]|uniref:Lipoprotein n=1 Tax=Telluria mixta TaxID=34071 RepID=A0ABT2BU22_9BURK|nr:hypothetical protein [Telluria mixta]MCS0628141.1 hypothetical protein [Telluria mixta]WEM93743.1 hypothetical protein P0M04_19860 [Telluria mixta]
MRRACTAAVAAAVLAGCVSPQLTRHYDSVDETSVSNINLKLSVFLASPKADEEPPLITTLAERGQAELIRTVAAKMPAGSDATALLNALGTAVAPPPEDCAWADRTSLKKRVTMTVLGTLGRPADRIDRLEFRFTLPQDKRYAFASWDKFDSVYGSYDLGSAKYTQSQALKLGLTTTDTSNRANGAGSFVKTPNASYEMTNGLEENMNYVIRRLNVGGALEPDEATLVQEGGPYINLLGSSSAVFTLKMRSTGDPRPVHVLAFKNGSKTAPDDVAMKVCQAKYPARRDPLVVDVGGTALMRMVANHHDTISEGDDTVKFVRKDFAATRVQIADATDLKVEFFGLVSCRKGQREHECLRLGVENPDTGKVENPLLVRTAAHAADVRDWLLAHLQADKAPETIATRRIGLVKAPTEPAQESDMALTPAIVRSLRVAPIVNNAGPAG